MPFVIVPMLRFVYSEGIMGEHKISKMKLIILSLLSLLLQAINIYSIVAVLNSASTFVFITMMILVVVQNAFIIYLIFIPIANKHSEQKQVEKIENSNDTETLILNN